MSREFLNVYPRMETPHCLWTSCGTAQPLSQWKRFSWSSDGASCVSDCARCLWSCHWKEPDSLLFSLCQVFIHIGEIQPSLPQNEQSSQILSSTAIILECKCPAGKSDLLLLFALPSTLWNVFRWLQHGPLLHQLFPQLRIAALKLTWFFNTHEVTIVNEVTSENIVNIKVQKRAER